MLGRRVQFGRGDRVRPLGRERQMPRPLLHVGHVFGQHAVRRPALLGRSLLVTDRRQQRMDEAHALAFDRDDTLAHGEIQRIVHVIRAAEHRGDELDGRSARHGRGEHHLADLDRQACEPFAEQVAEAVGHPEARSTPTRAP